MLELRLLSHALVLSEHRNFGRAAKSLNLSQPALSRSIQSLESQLGLRLFDRNRKGVEPTEAGRLLLKRARDLIVHAEDIEQETSAVGLGTVGEVKVAAGPYAAKMLLGRALGPLLSGASELKFRLIVDNWAESARLLREREVDLAVCDTSEIDTSIFEVMPLASHQVYCVVRKDHPLDRETSNFSEVRRWPLGVTAALPPRVLGRLTPKHKSGRHQTAVHCEDLEILKEIVVASDLVMLLPLCLAADELRRGTLRALSLEENWLKTQYGVIKLKGRTLPSACGLLIEQLQQVDAECHQLGEKLGSEIFVPLLKKRTKAARKGTSTKK